MHVIECTSSPTMTKQLSVCRLLEDDNSWPKRRDGHVKTTAVGESPELLGKVLQVRPRSTAQKQEHIVVEALRPCAIDYYIRHGQYLEKRGPYMYIYTQLRQEQIASMTFSVKFDAVLGEQGLTKDLQ